jgi:acetyltransferase-like isoleucine patch superfamily enzyme
MLSKLSNIWALDPSRRWQWLRFTVLRLKTSLLLRYRLRGCGQRNIVEHPLFWTPEFITLGNNCHLWPGCRIEGISCDGSQHFLPHIVFGDNIGIQQNCHITAASTLTIGNDVNVLCGAMITDIDHGYDDLQINFANQPLRVVETQIGDNCFIGAGAKILAGTTLGSNCIVGANAVVRGNFPPGTMIAGIPARIIKRYDQASRSWRSIHTDCVLTTMPLPENSK